MTKGDHEKLREIIDQIENGDLQYSLLLASTPYSLSRQIEQNEFLKSVQGHLARHKMDGHILRDRAMCLMSRYAEQGYMNPVEMPLCAYLFLLSGPYFRDVELLGQLAESGREDLPDAIALARRYNEASSQEDSITVSETEKRIVLGEQGYHLWDDFDGKNGSFTHEWVIDPERVTRVVKTVQKKELRYA